MIYTLPNTALFCPEVFGISFVGNIMINTSPLNGVMQTVEFPGDRRLFSLQYGAHANADMGPLRAFWNRFRGQAHTLRIWNLAHPKSKTYSGVPTAAAAVEGANAVSLIGGTGTLTPGDWIGITLSNGKVQTVEVAESTGANNVLAQINPPLRASVLNGAVVILERAPIDCLLTAAPMIPHGRGAAQGLGIADGFTVECVEFIE